MKNLITLFLIVFIHSLASAQVECGIIGPVDVDCIQQEELFYFLRCDSSKTYAIDWTLEPEFGGDIVYEDSLSAQLILFENGTFILTAFIETEFGIDTIQKQIFYFTEPIELVVDSCASTYFNENSGCYQVCEYGSTTAFTTNQGQGNGQWSVSGAEEIRDFGDRIEVDWGVAGRGSITYIDFCGENTICFDILPTPIPDFTTLPSAGTDTLVVCKNQEIFFENLSEGAFSYSWDFGDGERAESFDASHAYETEGLYTVILSANSVCDCSEQKELFVRVLDAPAPTLDCVNSVCPETRQKYTAATDGCSTYTWSISDNGTIISGGGSADNFIEIIWHEGPDGIIELSVSDCNTTYCSFVNTFRVPIITPDGPIEGDASVCSGEIVQYSAPYFLGTEYTWNVSANGSIRGDQGFNAITVQWDDVNAARSAVVSVSYNNCFLECSGEDEFNVNITPKISINAPAQACQDDMVMASATAGFLSPTPAPVNWEIQDVDGTVVFSGGPSSDINVPFNFTPGEYYWVATNSSDSYCNTEIRQRVTVTPTPPAPITISGENKICPGLSYGYTIENAGDYETNWVITDGTGTFNYSGQTITHSFGSTPPYTIEARHVDVQFPTCASSPIIFTVENGISDVINGLDTSCFESIDSYSNELIGGADYSWSVVPNDMGEVLVNNTNEVQVFWTKAGDATLRLNVCNVTIDKPVHVRANPVFTLSGSFSACGNEQTTIGTDASGLEHRWKNENGSFIANGETADLFPGFYSVEVIDAYGCSTEEAFEIEGLPFPQVSLTSPQLDIYCDNIPDGIPLVANTDGEDYVFTWYQDGTAVGNGPTFLATDFAEYQVEATNQFGCSALSLKAVIGSCCPVDECIADTIVDNPGGCTYLPWDYEVRIEDLSCNQKQYTPRHPDLINGTGRWVISSISDGYIARYNSDQASHTYDLPGYYRVVFAGQLAGYNYPLAQCDHQDLFIDTVRAVADFKVETACAGDLVELEDLTTFIPGETITGWSWDFDDPASGAMNTSTDQNPDHTFNTPGTYNITLTVTASSGCISTKAKELIVSGGPELSVVYDELNCENNATAFSLSGAEFNINWDFGDPTSGDENMAISTDVLHTYETAGIYNVVVSAEDVYGCSNTMILPVDIKANTLAGNIDIDPSSTICQGESVDLTAPSGGTSWTWSTEENTETITVTQTDQYSVFIKDDNNCTYTAPAELITVLPKPVVITKARIVYGPDDYGPWVDRLTVCDNENFEIHALSTQTLNYLWDGGSTNQVLIFSGDGTSFPGPGIHVFTVEGTDPITGCTSESASIEVEVYDVPDQPIIQITNGSACSFDANVLEVTNPAAGLQYIWSDGQKGTQIEVSEAGMYTVTAINANGCESVSDILRIERSEPVDRLPGGCFDACDPLTVCLPNLNNVASYVIYRNGTVIASGNTWPDDFLADEDGSYTIEVTSTNGCVATSLPLDITLYTGVGILTIQVYVDVDNDGTISAADTLIAGIPVRAEAISDTQTGDAETEADGAFDFVDFPAGGYLNLIDRDLLDPKWTVLIDSLTADINTCDDSTSVALLITDNCVVNGPTLEFESCEGEPFTYGDSTWTDLGLFQHHYLSSEGCDSIVGINIVLPDSFTLDLTSWMDLNEDALVGLPDTLLPNIELIVRDLSDGTETSHNTGTGANTTIELPVGNYLVFIDPASLDPLYVPVLDNFSVVDTDCGVIELDFLLKASCKPLTVLESRTICFGDSTLIDGNWESTAGVYSEIISDPASLCDTTAQITLEVLPELIVDADITNECDGMGGSGSITLIITGESPFRYDWAPRVSNDSIASNLTPGDYSVTVTDRNNCSVSKQYTIDTVGQLQFSIMPLFQIEENGSAVLEIMGDISEPGLTVQWDPVTDLSCSDCFAPEASPSVTTTYTVTITDGLNCSYNLITTVEVLEPCRSEFFLDDEVFVFEGDTTTLSIVGAINQPGITVFWTPDTDLSCPDCFTTQAYPTVTTSYIATITEDDGCIYELPTVVTVLTDSVAPPIDVFMPNVFVPESNTENNRYRLKSFNPDTKLVRMSIFNRRGAELYHENNVLVNQMQGWDGRANNIIVSPQVLVFVAEVEYPDGRIEQYTGDLTLVR